MFVICAGNWGNASGAGVFNRNWNNNRSNSNNNNGFRAADYVFILTFREGNTGDIGGLSSCHLGEICGPRCSSTKWKVHMPKRHANLYEECFTMEALFEAYYRARAGKREKYSVMEFERELGANIVQLKAELDAYDPSDSDPSYQPQPYRRFMVTEPKPREIAAPAFRDVVVQHAIYAVIYPLFDKTFIHDSYGCRVGKGTHRANDQAQRFLRQCPDGSYTLQLDIRRFYYRIRRGILQRLLERKIKDRRLVALIMMFAESDSRFGVPIGNLLSQLLALIYLNPLDHYVKRVLKIKRYVRYVDDFILFGLTRERAFQCRRMIEQFLRDALGLELSRWTVAPASRGVNFVGFRTWRRTRYVRKHSLYRFSKSLKRGDVASLTSIMGNALRTATYAHLCRRIASERPDLIPRLPLYREVKHA